MIAVIASTTAAACGDSPSAQHNRDAAIYVAVLEWFLVSHPPDLEETSSDLPTLYIEPIGAADLSIEIQVQVLNSLTELASVRFTDARAEAVDESDELRSVREGGMLVGLGAIPAGSPVVVRGEVYRDVDDIDGYLLTVRPRGDHWNVVGEPEPVPVEGLAVPVD